ncbi:MAG: tRNA-intron lyase [Halobacteriota archaeon]
MTVEIKDDRVVLSRKLAEEQELTSCGRLKGDHVELSFVEAAFLIERQRLDIGTPLKEFFKLASIRQPYFDLKYVVYRDLRERGYYIQPSVTDFRLYPRGGRPGEVPASAYVYVLSERIPICFGDIVDKVKISQNVRKAMLLAIVDGESDLTFYEARNATMRGKMPAFDMDLSGADATFLEDRVVIWGQHEATGLHRTGFYGKLVDGKRLQLSLIECAYLMAYGLPVVDGATNKRFTLKRFIRRAEAIEPAFKLKLQVYTDLRNRGFVAKTGFKFGSHFRVYEEINDVDRIPHSKYLVHALPEDYVVTLPEMSRAIRLAHGVRKRMIFAYCCRNALEYLDIGRAKP